MDLIKPDNQDIIKFEYPNDVKNKNTILKLIFFNSLGHQNSTFNFLFIIFTFSSLFCPPFPQALTLIQINSSFHLPPSAYSIFFVSILLTQYFICPVEYLIIYIYYIGVIKLLFNSQPAYIINLGANTRTCPRTSIKHIPIYLPIPYQSTSIQLLTTSQKMFQFNYSREQRQRSNSNSNGQPYSVSNNDSIDGGNQMPRNTKQVSQKYKNQIRRRQKQKLISQIRYKLHCPSQQLNHQEQAGYKLRTSQIWRQFVSSVTQITETNGDSPDNFIVPLQVVKYFNHLQQDNLKEAETIINHHLRIDSLLNLIFVTLSVQTYQLQTSYFFKKIISYFSPYLQQGNHQHPTLIPQQKQKQLQKIENELGNQLNLINQLNISPLSKYEQIYIDYFIKFLHKLNNSYCHLPQILQLRCAMVVKNYFLHYWNKFIDQMSYSNFPQTNQQNKHGFYILPNFINDKQSGHSQNKISSINLALCAEITQRLIALIQLIPNIKQFVYRILTVLIKYDRSIQTYFLAKVALNCLGSYSSSLLLDPNFSEFLYEGFSVQTVNITCRIIQYIIGDVQLLDIFNIDFSRLLKIMYGTYIKIAQLCTLSSQCSLKQKQKQYQLKQNRIFEINRPNKGIQYINVASYRKINCYILNLFYNFAFSQIQGIQQFFGSIDYEQMFITTFGVTVDTNGKKQNRESFSHYSENIDRSQLLNVKFGNLQNVMFDFLDLCIAILFNFPSTKIFTSMLCGYYLQLVQLSCEYIFSAYGSFRDHKKRNKTWQFARDLLQVMELAIDNKLMINLLAQKIQKVVHCLQNIVVNCKQQQKATDQFEQILKQFQVLASRCVDIL